MIFNTFVYLLAAGLFLMFLPKPQHTRWTAFLIFMFLAWLFVTFLEHSLHRDAQSLVYHWIRYKNFHLTLSLSSNFYNYYFLLPVFMVSLLAAFSNIFYPFENQRLSLAALIILNLAAFILLIASQNTLQLLISSSAIGIIGFYVINDFEARQKYMYYNLLADMGLLTVFAVLYGRLGSIELSELKRFGADGVYLNFIPLLLLFSVFMKSGLFMFQDLFSNWRQLNFNRMMLASFCLSPISSIAILSKTNVILQFSPYSRSLMALFAVATLIWGFFGALSKDNIRAKAMYLNMMMYGFFFGLLSSTVGQVDDNYPFLLLALYLVNASLSLVNLAASNETDISKMGGFIRSLKITFLLSLLIVFADIQTVLTVARPSVRYWVWMFLGLQLLALGQIYREIYFTKIRADERVWALLRNPNGLVMFVLAAVSGVIIYGTYRGGYLPAAVFAFFILAMLAAPFRAVSRLYGNETVQDGDFLNRIYENLLIAPIKIIGRVLWLTVDFLLIERTILASLSHFTDFLVAVSRRIQAYGWISYLLLSAAGLAVMLYWGINGGFHG